MFGWNKQCRKGGHADAGLQTSIVALRDSQISERGPLLLTIEIAYIRRKLKTAGSVAFLMSLVCG